MLHSVVNMLTPSATTLFGVEPQNMADRIRVARQTRGLSVDQLAALCGVTRGAVYQWEQGAVEGIKPINFVRLIRVLNTSAEYLVWGPDGPPQSDPAATAGPLRQRR